MAIPTPDAGSGLRERKKVETRHRLIQTAFELFAQNGYDQTTLAQIAERAGVAPRTVSNYFPLKVDLLVAYREDMLAVIEDVLRRRRDLGPLERIKSALVAVARENQRHPNGRLAQRLLAKHGSYQALLRIQDRFRADVLTTLEDVPVREGVDRELAVLALVAAHLAVIQRWAREESSTVSGDVAKLFDIWLKGVAA